jgi:glycosyltransferase involved in cell wall biosynthesis
MQFSDISIIVTAHREGRLAHRAMQSLWASVGRARGQGISCETIVTLDRADEATRDYFAKRQPDVRSFAVDFGDPGLARNFGVAQARGRYVCFLDADDVFCGTWLHRAFEAAEECGVPKVWHPMYVVTFEDQNLIWRLMSSSDRAFRRQDALEYWFWCSAIFAPRRILERHRYRETQPESGFGAEDSHLYCELLADGIGVGVVAKTCYFYRRRVGSRVTQQGALESIKRPSRLFDWPVLREMIDDAPFPRQAAAPIPEPVAETIPEPLPVAPAVEPISVVYEPTPAEPLLPEPLLPEPLLPELPVSEPQGRGRLARAVGRALLPWIVRHALRATFQKPSAPIAVASSAPSPPPPVVALAPPSPPPPPPTPPPPPAAASVPSPPPLPEWLVDEWKLAHAIEPLLFPEESYAENIHCHADRPPSVLGDAYVDLCKRLPKPISHVLIVPWMLRGGAEILTVNYVRALTEHNLAESVVVIATENHASPWAYRLPPAVPFLEFGSRYAPHLDARGQRLLLTHFLLQKKPSVINVIHSFLGHQMFAKHGAALASRSNLFVHAFCDGVSANGKWSGYGRMFLPHTFDHLTAVIGDNQTELDAMAQLFALDPAKMIAHYQPVECRPDARALQRNRGNGDTLHVLWAGRMDHQKRPDILAAIAKKCEGLPIHFHVYGAPVLDEGRGQVPSGPNITTYGFFESTQALPMYRYDVFLYTSQFDGLPIVLLEAMGAGLPIIASDVGGVAELVRRGETGILISPFDDVDRYVAALQDVASGREDLASFVDNGFDLVRRRHSWKTFVDGIRATPGYQSAPAGREAKVA